MKAAVVIPAYNEEKTISQVIQGVKKYVQDIIVVDDGSQDKTYVLAKQALAQTPRTMVLRHSINLGKGATLKTGCQAALQRGADLLITIDADGQHSASDIPKLIAKLKEENLDIVFGVRRIDKKIPFLRFLGNKLITKVINFLSGLSLNDTQSGFRAFTSQAYQKIIWQSSDYRVETEMIVKTGQHQLKYGQVPIATIYKDAYKGVTIFDGLKIVFHLFKCKFL